MAGDVGKRDGENVSGRSANPEKQKKPSEEQTPEKASTKDKGTLDPSEKPSTTPSDRQQAMDTIWKIIEQIHTRQVAYTTEKGLHVVKRGRPISGKSEVLDQAFSLKEVSKEVPEKQLLSMKENFAHVRTLEQWQQACHAVTDLALPDYARKHTLSVEECKECLAEKVRTLVGKSKVWTRTRPANLEKILLDGRFKSQFESGVMGTAAKMSRQYRARVERGLFAYPLDMEPVMRPIYGYLTDSPSGRSEWIQYYGTVAIRLKETVRARATVTMTDSTIATDTVSYVFALPSPVESPTFHSFSAYAYRETGAFFRFEDPLRCRSTQHIATGTYVEAQIHGGLRIDDIDHIFFSDLSEAAAHPRLLAQLHERGIDVSFASARDEQLDRYWWKQLKGQGIRLDFPLHTGRAHSFLDELGAKKQPLTLEDDPGGKADANR